MMESFVIRVSNINESDSFLYVTAVTKTLIKVIDKKGIIQYYPRDSKTLKGISKEDREKLEELVSIAGVDGVWNSGIDLAIKVAAKDNTCKFPDSIEDNDNIEKYVRLLGYKITEFK